MFTATILFVVLAFVTLVCGFKNVLVVVLEDNVFLPTLAARGVTKEFHFGSRTESVVGSLRDSRLSFNIYVDHKHGPCGLDPTILDKFNFLVSEDDIKHASVCSHVIAAKSMTFYAFKAPTFGFYFPQEGSNPNWLRNFVDDMLYSPLYEETLIVFLSQVSYTDSSASVLLLGKGVQHFTDSKERSFLLNLMISKGFSVTDPPSIPSGSLFDTLSFEKIFIVVLENQPLRITLRDKNFRKFISRGTLLTDYNALINPSQPNYFAMTAGDTRNCTGDDVINVNGTFIVDLFEEYGISWKAYMEQYPGNCFSGGTHGRYRRKHNPFVSFKQVRENPELCSKIVHSDQLQADVEANELPKYMFYTPDMDNDGHDTGIAYAGRWLNRFLSPLLTSQNFMNGTLVVITFDEGIKPDNKIYTLLLGDMIPAGHLDNTSYTHYSLLRLVEDQFLLPTLGRFDANASHINASNFYEGTVPYPSDLPYIVGGSALGVGILSAVGATVYYMQVVRKRIHKHKHMPKAAFGDMEESEMFLRVGTTPGNDSDGEKGPTTTTVTLSDSV